MAYSDLGNSMLGATTDAATGERAMGAARRAISLDPNLAEAHAALGRGLMISLRMAEAEAELRRAVELNPSDVLAQLWLGEWLAIRRRPDEAAVLAQRAGELDPLSSRTMTTTGFVLGLAGKDELAAAR